MARRLGREQFAMIALTAAWLGLWGAWIPNAATSLSQNIFYLAEWSTFLPGVRSGEIRLAPEVLRLSAALGACAILFAAQSIRVSWLRWLVRAAAALPVIMVLMPPYPDMFQLWWSPSYGARFGAASVLCAGLALSGFAGRFPGHIQRIAVVVMCALAVAAAATGLFFLLPPFQAGYAAPLAAGWGCAAFFAGLMLAAGAELAPEKQNGPVT